MEAQQPPIKPLTTITQSNNNDSNKPNKILRTTLQSYKDHENLKVVSKQVDVLTKYLKELTENLESHETSTEDGFIDFENKFSSLKTFFQESVASLELTGSVQAMTIMGIQENASELKEEISLLKEQAQSSLNTIQQLVKDQRITDNFLMSAKKNISATSQDLFNQTQSTLMQNIQNTIDTLKTDTSGLKEQTQSSLRELTALFDDTMKKVDEADTAKQKIIIFLTEEISELKNKQSGSVATASDVQKELSLFKEQLEKQQLLLESTNNKNTSLENTITQQTESISTLRRWLMALGGGSAIALTVWLWHYTHK